LARVRLHPKDGDALVADGVEEASGDGTGEFLRRVWDGLDGFEDLRSGLAQQGQGAKKPQTAKAPRDHYKIYVAISACFASSARAEKVDGLCANAASGNRVNVTPNDTVYSAARSNHRNTFWVILTRSSVDLLAAARMRQRKITHRRWQPTPALRQSVAGILPACARECNHGNACNQNRLHVCLPCH
jgi:hypothetical protein